jgi:two-component system sensor histidine kinase KdpD
VAGDVFVLTERGRTLDAWAGRLLSTTAGLLALAAEQELYRREATDAEVLRQTDDVRSRLLDAVSHDLRTPLASIAAAAGSLRQSDVEWTDADRVAFASTIEEETARMNRIVGNLLDLGRIQSGTLVPSRTWQDPTMVLSDVVERLRASAPDRPIELRAGGDLRPVFLDAVEIDQVVTNLIENAIRHTPVGTSIVVLADTADDELRITVEDSGPGFPAGLGDRVLDPFVGGASRRTRTGSGLGLAVSAGLVAAHGGRMWTENRDGGGARVSFAIPAPAPIAR